MTAPARQNTKGEAMTIHFPTRTLFRLLFLMAMGCVAAPCLAAEHTRDSLDTIKKAVADDKAVLLDVREKAEWEQGHLRDAKFLALSALRRGVKADELTRLLPKDKVIYCHCGSGLRCLQAADILKKNGYDVRPLKAGYKELVKSGFVPAAK
jgi:phage shock protein E